MSKDLDLQIRGEATIYRTDKWGYPSYSVKLSNQFDGAWQNKFLNVGLPKDTELENKTKIKINNGFLSFYKTRSGEFLDKIIITSFDIVNDTIGDIDIPTSNTEEYNTDLPF